jgi:hypothetical protein
MGILHSEWALSMREWEISIHGNLDSSEPWPPQAWLEWTVRSLYERDVLYSAGSIYCDVRRHLVTLGVLLECTVVL